MFININSKKHGIIICQIDDEDYQMIANGKLYYNCGYIGIYINKKSYLLHRYLMSVKKGQVIDHINHDTMDNRKNNLRVCTHQENMRNSIKRKTLTSKYKGVSWEKSTNKYKVQLTINNKNKYIGRYYCEKQAAIKYNEAIQDIYGEYAVLNIVE